MEKYSITNAEERKQFLQHLETKISAGLDIDLRVRSGELALLDQLNPNENTAELVDFDLEGHAEALSLIQKAQEVFQDICIKYAEISGSEFNFSEFVNWRAPESVDDPLRANIFIEKRLKNVFLDNVSPQLQTKSGESLPLNRDRLIASGLINLPESFPQVVSLIQRFMTLRNKILEFLDLDFDPVNILRPGEEIPESILEALEKRFQVFAEREYEKLVLFHWQKIANSINALNEMGYAPMPREANYPQAYKRVLRFGGRAFQRVLGFRGLNLIDACRKSEPR